VSKLTKIYEDVQNIEDVPGLLKNQIEHFFAHYKDLEPNKWVKIEGWAGLDAAKDEITSSIARYEKTL
jgi:inorganic pyrophosphatase